MLHLCFVAVHININTLQVMFKRPWALTQLRTLPDCICLQVAVIHIPRGRFRIHREDTPTSLKPHPFVSIMHSAAVSD